ncbi:MAG: hypothetical protein PHY36_00820 [Methanocellales archaeon]|nr:hypothetical protein [Methanocellales archaeon]MDD5446414.1 hypothetical protein [Methanocellales archaeon]
MKRKSREINPSFITTGKRFLFSKHKFCAKRLAGKKEVLDVGCVDVFANNL